MKNYTRDRKGRKRVQRTPGSALHSPFACFTLGSNVEVKLTGEGEEAKITGHWIANEELERIDGKEGKLFLVQRFLNWPDDPASILSFTRKHGPLLSSVPSAGGIFFSPTPKKGNSFEFMLEGGGYGWRNLQRDMRERWEAYIPIEHRRNHPTIPGPPPTKEQSFPTHLAQAFTKPPTDRVVTTETGEKFYYVNGRLEFEALNLARLLGLNLLSLAATGQLRKCYAENCANPYFITTDSKRFYCDDPCAASVQPQHKTRYREKKKKERMKAQARIPRRTTHRPTKKSRARRKKRRREEPASNP